MRNISLVERRGLFVLCMVPILLFCLAALVRQLSSAGQAVRGIQAKDYYVAPGGDDDNPGTLGLPWATIQHAAETVAPGDTVYVRGGVYNETVSLEVSGSANGGYITLRNYPDETPVLDGTGLSDPDGVNGFYIEDRHYLIIDGFEIRNFITAVRNAVPIGIQLVGASHHIQFLNNYIHHIETNAQVDGALAGSDAHGIVVHGSDETQSVHHLILDGNELAHLKLGSSEAMALNGNVEIFTVTHNLVHDVDNIAIALIGFEEIVGDPLLDRARNGVVAENMVYNVDSASNPAYGGDGSSGGDHSAGGIYVDGGRDVMIDRNRVYSANIGIEVASEHGVGNATNVTVRNNWIYHSHVAGIAIGGYDTDRGYTEDSVIVNNTLYHNDTTHSGSGELMMQYDTRNNVIKNNIFYANDQGLFISNAYSQNVGNQVDHNLYFGSSGVAQSEWMWKNVNHSGFDAYRNGTGNDGNSRFVDPLLVDTVQIDLHLQANSPALDAGDNSVLAGPFDFDGDARLQGGALDLGADERAPAVALPQIYLPLVINQEQQ